MTAYSVFKFCSIRCPTFIYPFSIPYGVFLVDIKYYINTGAVFTPYFIVTCLGYFIKSEMISFSF